MDDKIGDKTADRNRRKKMAVKKMANGKWATHKRRQKTVERNSRQEIAEREWPLENGAQKIGDRK